MNTTSPTSAAQKTSQYKERALNSVLVVVLLATFFLAWFFPRSTYYSDVRIAAGDEEMIFLRANHANEQVCLAEAGAMVNAMLAACNVCSATKLACTPRLDGNTAKLLAPAPISEPSATFPNGYIIFRSRNPDAALAACRETERQANQTQKAAITCLPANTNRPAPASKLPAFKDLILQGALCFGIALLVSWLLGAAIVRYEGLHARWSMDHADSGPQKFHTAPTPRIGGLCIAVGLLACATILPTFSATNASSLSLLLLAGLAPFVGGFSEDLTKKTGILTRLLFTMIGGGLAAWTLGAVLTHLDIPGIDALFTLPAFAIAFTIFAAGGVANSINIIDGFNGLASGFSLIASAAFAYVAYAVGAMDLFLVALALMGTLIGFLLWNYPHGKIFLGDGGAYLVGFLLAELSILLVVRHPEVSPWFPMAVLIYPVFETLFSAYRRLFLRGRSAGKPDAMHLHTLIFRRVVANSAKVSSQFQDQNKNRYVAPRILMIIGFVAISSAFLWKNTLELAALAGFACGAYIWVYFRIIRWRTPRWI